MSSVDVWTDRASARHAPVTVVWHKTAPHWTVEYDGRSWSYSSQQAAVAAAKRRVSAQAKGRPPEVLVFARGQWEFARQEENTITGRTQWIRRDSSWICYVGDEVAVMPVPPKPMKMFAPKPSTKIAES